EKRGNMKSNQHKITSLMKVLECAKSRRQARLVRGKLLKLVNHLSPELKESCIRHWDRLVSSKYLPY
ncbi:MAG: hypothetical protein MUO85_03650, partial [candidate division Zixibacteria bacterium]|nr:hypothetical protein [candidate division Zixibacteria bacterium]